MKWIGQHIYDFVSRFRNDVFLEGISTSTETDMLVVASDGKVTKRAIDAITVDVSDFMSSGADNRVLTATGTDAMQAETYLTFENTGNVSTLSLLSDQDTGDLLSIATTTHGATTITTTDDDATAAHFEIAADGHITLDAAGNIALEAATGDITGDADNYSFRSTASGKPLLTLETTNTTNSGSAELKFLKDAADTGDGEFLGQIGWYGDNDAGTPEEIQYAKIFSRTVDVSDGTERGALYLSVAEFDGNLSVGLGLSGTDTNGQVDVDLGAGAASVTKVTGTLTMGTTATINNSGVIQVATQGTIDHDSLANFVAAEHYRWDTDISATATINAANIPTLNQDTTGQAGTVATIAGLAPNTATTQATQPNITTLAGLTSLGAAGATTDIAAGDLTMYNAVNGGDPTISLGSSATNRFEIKSVYNSSAQTLDSVDFTSYTTSGTSNDARYRWFVDEVELARMLDTGFFVFKDRLQVQGEGATLHAYDPTASSATEGGALRLSSDDGAAMADNHRLGIITFEGAEDASSNLTVGAQIESFCDAGWSASENGARMVFSTTDGNASTSTVLTLDSNKLATFTGPIACTTRTLAVTSSTDGDANGDVAYFGGTTSMTVGKIYHYKSDGTWEIANADAVATADGLLGVALGAASDTNGMLLRGMVTLDHDPGAIGDVLYVQSDNAGTPGNATATAPSVSGDCVRIIGYQVSHASNGNIWFNPDNTFVEVA